MTRILSLPEMRVPELAAATGLDIKDIYRVVKMRRATTDKATVKPRAATASLKLSATEAVAVAASLHAAPKLAVDRSLMVGLFIDYLRSSRTDRMFEVDTDLYVDAAHVTIKIFKMMEAFTERNAWIESDPVVCGGDPVYRGTSISVHNIAKRLALGDSVEDINSDLPGLSRESILAAPQLAAAHPLRGRPRRLPRKPIAAGLSLNELKSALRKRAERNALDN